MPYSIGLDIGIASVGWSIIDSESGRILDLGSTLFSARESQENIDRRGYRQTRRGLRRKRTRLNESREYLINHGFPKDPELDKVCPYTLRVKGLTEALTKAEIHRSIQHLIKKRGISYLDEDAVADAAPTSEGDFKALVNENTQLEQTLTPGQIQLKRLQENNRVRTGKNAQEEYQLNVFTVHAYARELQRILETQREFHPEITQAFIDYYTLKPTGLIYRKRPYYHGPGNADNPSKYGRWKDYPRTGRPANNIFEQLIGLDFQGYIRASALSLSAQEYNVLNDLNNLRLPRENDRFTTEEKEQILTHLKNPDLKSFGPTALAKLFNFNVDDIKGWRIDKNEKKQLHHLKPYRSWLRIFNEAGLDATTLPRETYDTLASIVL